MQNLTISILLVLSIAAQVYYIFFHNPQVYEQYYPILIIIPAAIAAYLLVKYGRMKIQHISKPNPVVPAAQYQILKKTESERKVQELLKSQGFKRYQQIKEGRIPQRQLSEEQKQLQNQVIDELEQKQTEIFADQ